MTIVESIVSAPVAYERMTRTSYVASIERLVRFTVPGTIELGMTRLVAAIEAGPASVVASRTAAPRGPVHRAGIRGPS
jgi:hypothetical protein